MNTLNDNINQQNTRYRTELIHQLAEIGQISFTEKTDTVVQKFLETASKITDAHNIAVYEYDEKKGFRRRYVYDFVSGPKSGDASIVLTCDKFIQWIDNFQNQDFVIIRQRDEIPKQDLDMYEKLCKTKIDSMIAFRLTYNREMVGCMILENANIEKSAGFIELIPLIGVYLGNVRQNYKNEIEKKHNQDIIDEEKMELEKERQYLEVLSRDYTTVYHLDLKKDTLEALKMTDTANAARIETIQLRKKINYTENMKLYCREYVASRNKAGMQAFCDKTNLLKELSSNSRLVYRYESKPNIAGQHYFEMVLIRLNEGEFDGNALMAFRHIDDIITQEQRYQAELEEALEKERVNNEILSALGKIYYAIFRINLEKDVYEELTSDEEVHHLTGKRGCASVEMMEICRTFVVPEYQERIRKFFDLSTLSERLNEEDTIAEEYLAKDGNWHTARFIVKRRNSEGKATHVLYVTQLISDAKRREQNWIAIAEDANRANEAKSEFVSQIAHDIRTPMNAVFGFQELAEANITNPQKVEYCLKKIRVAGNFMQELVNDVLDISRMEHGRMELHPEWVSLTEIISEFTEVMEHSKKDKKLTFKSDIHDIIYDRILVDPLRIKQIYSNILSNAVKYTPDQGYVHFEVYEESIPNKQKVRVTAVISDTGIGMSEEYMEKMYAKFTRETDTRINKVNGYGLGLAIVKQLVDLMEGTIAVKSKIGKGTSFCITLDLPYSEDEVTIEQTNEKTLQTKQYEGMHLLVAEDNDLNYEVISELMSLYGITCERAEDGIVCIEKFEKTEPNTYDAILMDMQMPNMDGVESTKNIRKLNRKDAITIPIIAMTANVLQEDIQKCMNAGMNEYLAKPVNTEKLLEVLSCYRR